MMTKLKVFLLLMALISGNQAWAIWTGVLGPTGYCTPSYDTKVTIPANTHVAASCTLTVGNDNAVPATGTYRILYYLTAVAGDPKNAGELMSGSITLTAGTQLSEQDVTWNYGSYAFYSMDMNNYYICYNLRQDSTGKDFLFKNTPQGCLKTKNGGTTPLPPPPTPLSCQFNSGNPINVALGEISRNEIGTVPGTLPGMEKKLDVNCAGDGSATYSIKFQFTPKEVAGSELITSSVNGLAVALSFNDTVVSNTDSFSRTYSAGIQTETLGFEPVRDPAVEYTDIPTGAFTASAVMVITQE